MSTLFELFRALLRRGGTRHLWACVCAVAAIATMLAFGAGSALAAGPPSVEFQFSPTTTATTASLQALVNPNGNDTTCAVEYVDDADYQVSQFTNATQVPCTPADLGSGGAPIPSATITGLAPSTTYDLELVLTNSAGTVDGNATQFTTQPPPISASAPIVSESASTLSQTGATLNATINPSGVDATCVFQYVDDADFQSSQFTNATQVPCTPADLGAGTDNVTASALARGLTLGTAYDFRVVVTNSTGVIDGTATKFTTQGALTIDSTSASNVTSTGATLDTSINPLGTFTTCNFEYGTDTSYGNTANCGFLGAGTSSASTSAAVTGLTPSTTYHFRVDATNALTLNAVDGPDVTFTTLPPVTIDSATAANVTDTTATLKAEINPDGTDTTYQFSLAGTDLPAKPVDIGSATTGQAATVDVTGLQPNTSYTFQVTATNAQAPNGVTRTATFRTYASGQPAGLPDDRGYELVTPASTDSGEVSVRQGLIVGDLAAVDGDRMAYFSLNALPGSQSVGSAYLATRGAGGWASQALIPPQSTDVGTLCGATGATIAAYSDDLSRAVLADGAGQSEGCSTDSPELVNGEPKDVGNLFVRDNTNGSYQLVSVNPVTGPPANATFDAGSADLSHVVFDESAALTSDAPTSGDDLYDWSGGSVRLVTVLPDGTDVNGSLAGGTSGASLNAVSADGSRIFFTAGGNLYVRENGTTTVQVDSGVSGSQFAGASSDGSLAYFTAGGVLYETNLTGSAPQPVALTSTSASVQGVSAISGDGSAVYFVADGALAGAAQAGQPNLYVVQNGGQPKFIATLANGDSSDWSSGPTARLSTNGRFLVFNSVNSLTGYDNNGNDEMFLYDAASGQLSCASCIPSGVQASAGASIAAAEGISFAGPRVYPPRDVSNSGQVFFDTSDQLLPKATNGLSDVYEYEGGQVRLLSSGTSPDPSYFLDASASGNDVFLATSDHLTSQDPGGVMSVYDARVGGGFAAPAPASACQGAACRAQPLAPPPALSAASSGFTGPGDRKPAKPARTAKIRISGLKVLKNGAGFSVDVHIPGKGTITVAGHGLKTVAKAVRRAGNYRLTVGLSKTERRAMSRQRRTKVTVKARIGYRLTTGAESSVSKTITLSA